MLKRIFGKLYVQVLIGVVAGGLLGYFSPALGTDLKPLGDGFIRLIKKRFATACSLSSAWPCARRRWPRLARSPLRSANMASARCCRWAS